MERLPSMSAVVASLSTIPMDDLLDFGPTASKPETTPAQRDTDLLLDFLAPEQPATQQESTDITEMSTSSTMRSDDMKPEEMIEKQQRLIQRAFQKNSQLLLDQYSSLSAHSSLVNKILPDFDANIREQLQKHNQLIAEANALQAQFASLPMKVIEVKQLLALIARLEAKFK